MEHQHLLVQNLEQLLQEAAQKVVHMRQDLRFLLLQAAEADNWQEVLMAPVMLVTLVEAEELLVLMLLENLTLDLI